MSALSSSDLQSRHRVDTGSGPAPFPESRCARPDPGQTEYEMPAWFLRRFVATVGSTSTKPLVAIRVGAHGRTVIDADSTISITPRSLRGPQGTLYGAGSMGGTISW